MGPLDCPFPSCRKQLQEFYFFSKKSISKGDNPKQILNSSSIVVIRLLPFNTVY